VLEKLTDSRMSESQIFSFLWFGIRGISSTSNSKHTPKAE